MIRLHFLGYGSAYNMEFGNNSAWFTNQGSFFLLDCGEDVFRKVYGLPEFRQAVKVYAVITHMHTDHVGSLGELAGYSWSCLNRKIGIIYPDVRLRQYLALSGVQEGFYEYLGGSFETENLSVTACPVIHDPCMGCYGYRICDQEERIYYSGDSRAVDKEIVEQLKNGSLERLYLDASKYAAADSGHGCFEVLKQRISRPWRDRVVCMHLDCDFRQEIEEEGFRCPLPMNR